MDIQTIAKRFEGKKKGQLLTLVTNSEGKKRAAFKDMDIRKQSKYQCRWADYGNMRAVRESVAEGEREAPELPSYVESVETISGIKFWKGKNGEFYLPLPVDGNRAEKIWFLDGQEVRAEDVAGFLLASETQKKPSKDELAEKGQVPFMAVNIRNIVEIK